MTKKEKELRQVIVDIQWMARRYADGRMSYAPEMYNSAMQVALKHGVPLKKDTIEDPPTWWARQGHFSDGDSPIPKEVLYDDD